MRWLHLLLVDSKFNAFTLKNQKFGYLQKSLICPRNAKSNFGINSATGTDISIITAKIASVEEQIKNNEKRIEIVKTDIKNCENIEQKRYLFTKKLDIYKELEQLRTKEEHLRNEKIKLLLSVNSIVTNLNHYFIYIYLTYL